MYVYKDMRNDICAIDRFVKLESYFTHNNFIFHYIFTAYTVSGFNT